VVDDQHVLAGAIERLTEVVLAAAVGFAEISIVLAQMTNNE